MAAQPKARRRYDNTNRRALADATRARIVDAGAELQRGSAVRDWHAVTVADVASHAGVSERTIYRHFGSERGLRDAVLHRIETDVGVDLDGLRLDDIADVTARVLRYVSDHPAGPLTREPPLDSLLGDADARRRAALSRAVADVAGDWPEADRRVVAAVLDLLWNVSSYESIAGRWGLDYDDAIRGITWIIGLVEAAVREGERPL